MPNFDHYDQINHTIIDDTSQCSVIENTKSLVSSPDAYTVLESAGNNQQTAFDNMVIKHQKLAITAVLGFNAFSGVLIFTHNLAVNEVSRVSQALTRHRLKGE